MSATPFKNLIDKPVRKLTVSAGRGNDRLCDRVQQSPVAAELASGERVGEFFPSSAAAAQALSNANGAEASSDKGGAK